MSLKIAWGQVATFKLATFAGAPLAESFEGEYMFDTSPANRTRPNGRVDFDFGAAVNLKVIMGVNSNVVPGATAYSVTGDISAYPPSGSAVVTNLTKSATSWNELDETFRYWWFDFAQATPTPEIGKLAFFTNLLEVDKNYQERHKTGNEEGNVLRKGDFGQEEKYHRYRRAIREYPFRHIPRAQMLQFDEKIRVTEEAAIYDDKFDKPLYGYVTMRGGVDAERADKYNLTVRFTEYI